MLNRTVFMILTLIDRTGKLSMTLKRYYQVHHDFVPFSGIILR